MHALQLLQMDVFHPPLARFLGYTEQPVTLFHLLLELGCRRARSAPSTFLLCKLVTWSVC